MDEFKSDVEVLKSIVGEEMYGRIRREFAGSSIYIPKADKSSDYAAVYADMEAGLSFKQIAKKYNYTVVWVHSLYRRYLKMRFPSKKEVQHSLFNL